MSEERSLIERVRRVDEERRKGSTPLNQKVRQGIEFFGNTFSTRPRSLVMGPGIAPHDFARGSHSQAFRPRSSGRR